MVLYRTACLEATECPSAGGTNGSWSWSSRRSVRTKCCEARARAKAATTDISQLDRPASPGAFTFQQRTGRAAVAAQKRKAQNSGKSHFTGLLSVVLARLGLNLQRTLALPSEDVPFSRMERELYAMATLAASRLEAKVEIQIRKKYIVEASLKQGPFCRWSCLLSSLCSGSA